MELADVSESVVDYERKLKVCSNPAASEKANRELRIAFDRVVKEIRELEPHLIQLGNTLEKIQEYQATACFAAGTQLWMPEGYRNIEEFRPGDLIFSRSEHNSSGPIEAKVVEEVFKRFAPVLNLHVNGQVIATTAEHPFFAYNKGWVAANTLEVGDFILAENGDWKRVEDLFDTGDWQPVYNLRVADWHTYFVGGDSWGWAAWAHNTCSKEFYLTEDSDPLHQGTYTLFEKSNGSRVVGSNGQSVWKPSFKSMLAYLKSSAATRAGYPSAT
jgi:Pretoxin HINT domain